MTFHNASGAGTNAELFLTGSEAQAARLAAGGACTNISFRTGERPVGGSRRVRAGAYRCAAAGRIALAWLAYPRACP